MTISNTIEVHAFTAM